MASNPSSIDTQQKQQKQQEQQWVGFQLGPEVLTIWLQNEWYLSNDDTIKKEQTTVPHRGRYQETNTCYDWLGNTSQHTFHYWTIAGVNDLVNVYLAKYGLTLDKEISLEFLCSRWKGSMVLDIKPLDSK